MSRGSIVIPLFLLIALSILFLGHYFAYFSLIHFFSIDSPAHKATLAAILWFFAVSFFASSILAHWTDNLFSRVYYFVSSLWLGAGLTLITALALAWAAWLVSRIFIPGSNPRWLGTLAVALACIYSAYGIWNAYHPRVVNLTVRIKNLPPAWQGKKLVQISDVHLGQILGARFLERIVAQVNAQAPDLGKRPKLAVLTGVGSMCPLSEWWTLREK
jgi:hypothetical protein